MSIPYFIAPREEFRGFLPDFPHPAYGFLSGLFFLVLIFYGNYHILLPKVLKRRGWTFYLPIVGVILFVFATIQITIREAFFGTFEPFGIYNPFFKRIGMLGMLAFQSLAFAISTGIWLLQEWRSTEKQLQESEQKRIETELDQLKKQLNPHFLFNTLNGIYAMSLTGDQAAPDAILRLSKLMSYVLTDASNDFINLGKDVEHLQHFIALHQLRLSEKSPLNVQIDGPMERYSIAPLLLLPFVENAFKYGISNIEYSPISIRLQVIDHNLRFYCSNRIIKKKLREVPGTGLGIQNVKRRLELIYPDHHQLEIREEDKYFIVHLRIQLRKQPISAVQQSLTQQSIKL
ncbi:MAG: histidine kinase [Bacteroidota bacterium]